ncbi:shikimate kinase [Jeotgalibacillus malaysiensis]|uniref:shikimate kinase n=1 Tax=Jeotgalibacillus malaysiensis TaxID=1508404 RepID=UPI00384D7302
MKIYLVGFMGAGKSTVGRLLSKELNLSFVDLDHVIEQQSDKKISDIFKEDGEIAFRKIEADSLRNSDAEIIATGGGILYMEETGRWMRNEGTIIYLHAPFEELYARIQGDTSRPVAARPYEELKNLYEKRDREYRSVSHHQVSVSDCSPQETVSEMISLLR